MRSEVFDNTRWHTAPSARERFCAVLASGPLLRGDAIVLLQGDGLTRVPAAVELLRQGAGPFIVVSGGVENEPYAVPAEKIAARLMGLGVGHDRIILDAVSRNTHEQAVEVVRIALEHDWKRLVLVASPYHAPRAFLTFLKVLLDENKADTLHLVMVPASHTPWFARPEGLETTRFDLLADEYRKIEEYQGKGHVASYEDGIAYLKQWEGR